MTLKLRPHHLLCILTYVGKGYSPEFVANFGAVVARIGAGEDVEIVLGPDDICRPLLGDPRAHCLKHGAAHRDDHAARAVADTLSISVSPGSVVALDQQIRSRLQANFSLSTIRTACHGCEWAALCTAVAENGYQQTLLGKTL